MGAIVVLSWVARSSALARDAIRVLVPEGLRAKYQLSI